MNPFKNTSIKQLRGKLLVRGVTVPEFAEAHGFKVTTVRNVLNRYCESDAEPRGILTARILETLNEFAEGVTQ